MLTRGGSGDRSVRSDGRFAPPDHAGRSGGDPPADHRRRTRSRPGDTVQSLASRMAYRISSSSGSCRSTTWPRTQARAGPEGEAGRLRGSASLNATRSPRPLLAGLNLRRDVGPHAAGAAAERAKPAHHRDAMSAAISPYSIAVAPFWSVSNLRNVFRIAFTPPSSGPRPRGLFTSLRVNNSCGAEVNGASSIAGSAAASRRRNAGFRTFLSTRAIARRGGEVPLGRRDGGSRTAAAAIARQDVGRAHRAQVANEVAEAFVGDLDAVDIDHRHGEARAGQQGRQAGGLDPRMDVRVAAPITSSAARIAARSSGSVSPPASRR